MPTIEQMKKITLSFLTFLSCVALAAQGQFYIVEGKILDKETKAPLQGASVFAQNTTLGTASGPDGNCICLMEDMTL